MNRKTGRREGFFVRPSRLPLFLCPLLSWLACSSSDAPPAKRPLSADEVAIRARLGVPFDAKTVMVFSQTAHLDIDWQKTFADYYAAYVGDVFTEARTILQQQPRAFYSVAEMAYLEHHVATHPDELPLLQEAAKRGALRIVGGGMTSPDTLLPETELLMRDYLFGIQFAEDRIGAHPKAAWLPDSFGHAATVPDLLAAAGYTSVAFARVDGAPTLFEAIFHQDIPPKPGSTAEQLQQLGSADFVWRGPGGAKILAHYMTSNLYCTGDNIDYGEKLQLPGGHVGGFNGDDTTYTDGQIDGYGAALDPYAKTPYRFVTVGCDFAHPKPRLIEYLDGYNKRRYPTTGIWAVAATFEEYSTLVSSYKDLLPELAIDVTPYFMGFYGSRAAVKRRTRDAARPFFAAETFATALGADGATLMHAAAPAWKKLARSNHHDFVTGTSADDVVANEQLPLLKEAETAGRAVLAEVALAIAKRIPATQGAIARVLAFNPSGVARTDVGDFALPITGGTVPVFHAVAGSVDVPFEIVGTPAAGDTTATVRLALSALPPFSWRAIDLVAGAATAAPQVKLEQLDANGAPATGGAVTRVVVSNTHVRAEWNRGASGFAMTSLTIDGAQAIARESFAAREYTDTGGLWRTGNEMPGCVLTPVASPADDETIDVLESSSLIVRVAFKSSTQVREAALGAGATGLSLAITTGAREGTTRTVSLSLAASAGAKLRTSVAGGFVERPAERLYTPTFWPAVGWAAVDGWAILLRQSTGVRMSAPGEIELMSVRDARSEHCDLEGGIGSDAETHRIEWRIERAPTAADAERAAQAFNRSIEIALVGADQATTIDFLPEQSLARVDGEGIVSAIKPADRGDGAIVRALLFSGSVTVHLSPALAGRQLTIVDVAERDQQALGAAGDAIVLDPARYGSIATVRLH